jgi:hypothetical protein
VDPTLAVAATVIAPSGLPVRGFRGVKTMTDGERLVWAAVYGSAVTRQSPGLRTSAQDAAAEASLAVVDLRIAAVNMPDHALTKQMTSAGVVPADTGADE